jgi:hypothetical protein
MKLTFAKVSLLVFVTWFTRMCEDGVWADAVAASPPYGTEMEKRWTALAVMCPDFPAGAVLHPSAKTIKALRARGIRWVRLSPLAPSHLLCPVEEEKDGQADGG